MPGLLDKPVTDADRTANNTHRPTAVVAVLAILCVYLYLFTQVADDLGLPLPEELSEQVGLDVRHVFDDDGNVDSNLVISMTQRIEDNDDERLIYFTVLILAFLCVYFAPVAVKQPAMLGWTLLALLVLYGVEATSALLLAHVVVYLVLHPDVARRRAVSALAGLLGWAAFVQDSAPVPVSMAAALVLPVLAVLAQEALRRVLSAPVAAAVLRPLVVHSAIVFMCVAVAVEGSGGPEWRLAKGLLMFFWQWPRVALYFVDYQDGQVPRDQSLHGYLAVFISLGVVPNWNWGVAIPQGYAYLDSNFLARDKNRLVFEGVQILAIALLYLVTWSWVRYALVDLFDALGIPLYRAHIRTMVRAFMRGEDISTASVLATTFFDLFRFMMYLGGVLHFKVGVWRLMGFDVAPYYNRYWTSTNMVTLWARFAFHYREFMVRAFYYPVFLRFFRRRPFLRVFAATMFATAVGNLLWHISERVGFNGFEWDHVVYRLGTWPYFLALGLGIVCAQLYMLKRKRRRKPWTRDRWLVGDVISAYVTIQYFGLIHIFARPAGGADTWDLFRLFARGFGLQL